MKKYKVFSTYPDPDNSAFLDSRLKDIVDSLQEEQWQIERIDCNNVTRGWSAKQQKYIPCLQYIIIASYESEEKDE